jgi:PAS domain S-box-containing protein
MRNNQPVTGVEYILRDDQSPVSRTDLKGIITFANADFIEASGFDEDELLGQPHNIVRHPDMPVEAFADLWKYLHAGESWTGMVKNRRKNGDHYWVLSNASPMWEGGKVVGFASVRMKPPREAIAPTRPSTAAFGKVRPVACASSAAMLCAQDCWRCLTNSRTPAFAVVWSICCCWPLFS